MQLERPRFFEWERYRSERPAELRGEPGGEHPVIIVGAGPVGLALALSLARQAIAVVLLEAKDQLSDNSRTLAVARRSVQLLDRLGVVEAFRARAITREFNYVYHGKNLVHQAAYGCEAQEKYPDISVLQQPWTEKALLDGVMATPLVDLRWRHRVLAVESAGADASAVKVQAPEGEYVLTGRYVVAADGARGQVRRSLGLAYDEVGDGVLPRNFVICDFELPTDLPVARRLWIAPAYRPKSAVILHRQPFDTWRLDYALEDDEDLEQALQPEAVARNVKAQLALMGLPGDGFRLVWISSYRPMSRSLPSYRSGNVFFAGDAAHQTPIFGGRGMNQGLLDAANLAWKLAYVLKGWAPASLLDTYDAQRRPLIVQNLHDIGLATLCMTAPTRGAALMRKAAFDLLPTEKFVLPLIDAFNANKSELLPDAPTDTAADAAAPVGGPLPDCRILREGRAGFLHDLLSPTAFTSFFFGADGAAADMAWAPVGGHVAVQVGMPGQGRVALDSEQARARLDVQAGDWILVRPDGYIQARMNRPTVADMQDEYARALGRRT